MSLQCSRYTVSVGLSYLTAVAEKDATGLCSTRQTKALNSVILQDTRKLLYTIILQDMRKLLYTIILQDTH